MVKRRKLLELFLYFGGVCPKTKSLIDESSWGLREWLSSLTCNVLIYKFVKSKSR